MGHRCYLFVHEADAGPEGIGLAECVAETNNRFALEWLAWLPTEALETHLSALVEHRRRFESDDDDDQDPPRAAVDAAVIVVPHEEAVRTVRGVLAPALLEHPELGSAMGALWREVESRASRLRDPVVRFELLQMANFEGIDDYAEDLRRHRDFWAGATPWERVSSSTDAVASPSIVHPLDPGGRDLVAALEEEASALEARAHGTRDASRPRWRERHESLVEWALGLVCAAGFLVGYVLSGSPWWGAAGFVLTAAAVGCLVGGTSRRPVRDRDALVEARAVRSRIEGLRRRHVLTDPWTGLDAESLRRWPPSFADGPVTWDVEGLDADPWAGGRTRLGWDEIEGFGTTLDDGPSEAMTLWTVDVAESSPRVEEDVSWWFGFDSSMSPGLLLTCLDLLREVYGRDPRSPRQGGHW